MRAIRQLILMISIPAMLVGCRASGVGDPCAPEVVPEGGFNMAEAYLETSSVQCRTRVCMVYQLEGDPSESREECEARDGLGGLPKQPPPALHRRTGLLHLPLRRASLERRTALRVWRRVHLHRGLGPRR